MVTRTFTTYFNTKTVDRLLGEAHRELESDYLERKEFISPQHQLAIEARLQTLRATWMLLLEKVPE